MIRLETICVLSGNKESYLFGSELLEVEHIKLHNFNHVTIWLKYWNVIIPCVFNDISIFTIVKK